MEASMAVAIVNLFASDGPETPGIVKSGTPQSQRAPRSLGARRSRIQMLLRLAAKEYDGWLERGSKLVGPVVCFGV